MKAPLMTMLNLQAVHRSHRSPGRIAAGALLGTLVLAAGAGCSSSATNTVATPTTGGASAGTTKVVDSSARWVGRYAHFDAVAYADATMKNVIISTGLSDLFMRDGKLWNQMTFCHAEVSSVPPVTVTIADAATRAIIPVAAPVTVTDVNGKAQLSRAATPTAIGIKLVDPTNDVLPTDPKDPRIFDADGDGNPGVTSHVKVTEELQGDVFLARREIFAYDVTEQTPDRLVGHITDRSEQLILGASNPIFLATAQWKQLDDKARNPVIWQRVDADFDCEKLAAKRNEMFPPNPTVDW